MFLSCIGSMYCKILKSMCSTCYVFIDSLLFLMVTVDDELSLAGAIEATEHLFLRELASHVGPLLVGVITPAALPLKEMLA